MADATREAGIIVTVKDAATAILKKIGVGGATAFGAVRKAVNQVGPALKSLGVGFALANQTLELFKKGVELFKYLLLDNITAMVEYRGELDPIAKQYKKLGDDAKYLKAIIFDVLTPVIFGLRDAFAEAYDSAVDFVNSNRQLIATNITTFLADTARILVKGVAEGLVWASRAVSGLIEAWHLLSAAVETATSLVIEAVANIIDGLTIAADWAGKDELAASFRRASATARELGDTFSHSADQSMAKVEEQVRKQKEFEDALQKFKTVAVDFVGEAEVAILERIERGWRAVKRHTDEATNAVKNQIEAYRSLEPTIAQLWQRKADLYEKSARWIEQEKAKQDELYKAIGTAIGTNLTAAWVAVASGAKDAGQQAKMAVINMAEAAVMSYAASAAAAAAFSQAGIPIAGPILATTAAALVFGTVKALMAEIPKAALGGIAISGPPGRDVLPVFMQRGEGVLRPGQTQAIMRLADALERNKNAAGATINLTFAPRIEQWDAGTPETRKRVLLEMNREMEELVADGVILANVARR